MSKSEKLYSDTPTVKRDKEGKVGVSRPSQADSEDIGLQGEGGTPGHSDEMEMHHMNERREVAHKHVKEHLDLHHRHAQEHAAHKGDKHELHMKHEEEHKDMRDRHEKELAQMHERHEQTPQNDGNLEGGSI